MPKSVYADLTETLLSINGASGQEEHIRTFIVNELEPLMDSVTVDSYGNVCAERYFGRGPVVLLNAHMDTVLPFEPGRVIIKEDDVWSSSAGILGADDRAGMAAVLAATKTVCRNHDFRGTLKVGTGGMQSKLMAAKTALQAGVKVFIGNGVGANKLIDIVHGNGDGTYVEGETRAVLPSQKQWISFTEVSGKLFIDEGAEKALILDGKSLLPAGIIKAEGEFVKGDVVEVYCATRLLGRGEVLYSKAELTQALSKRLS